MKGRLETGDVDPVHVEHGLARPSGRRLSLTDAGRELLAQAVPVWRGTHDEIDRLLEAGRGAPLRADLLALSGAAAGAETG